MPRYLGEKARLIAEAAARENAALAALQTAESERLVALAQELAQARADKDRAKSEPEDKFHCAWCRDGEDKSGEFRSKARMVFEVTAHFVFDEAGETELEHLSREKPFYLVACSGCGNGLKLIEHLTE